MHCICSPQQVPIGLCCLCPSNLFPRNSRGLRGPPEQTLVPIGAYALHMQPPTGAYRPMLPMPLKPVSQESQEPTKTL